MNNTNPYQYGYNNGNVNQQNVQNQSQTLAVVSLIFGIVTFLGSAFVIGTLPVFLVAMITGIIVLVKNKAGKGLAIAGIITSVIGAIISCALLAVCMPFVEFTMDLAENPETVIENYQENGEIPEALEGMDDEIVEAFMQGVIEGYYGG